MIQATARADTFVRVFEERALRAQYLLHARFAPGTEATLERASETCPVCCGHKDHNNWDLLPIVSRFG